LKDIRQLSGSILSQEEIRRKDLAGLEVEEVKEHLPNYLRLSWKKRGEKL